MGGRRWVVAGTATGAVAVLVAALVAADAGRLPWPASGHPVAAAKPSVSRSPAPDRRAAPSATPRVTPKRPRPLPRPGRARGTNAWRLTNPTAHAEIEGYGNRISVAPGQSLALRVSTTARRFRVRAYRFGWYRGGQARLQWRSGWVPGRVQAGASMSDEATRTVVARWRESLAVPTAGWPAGAYVLKLIASSGPQSYVPLFVRSPSVAGRVALVAPVATWQAYNAWGGYSLYTGAPGDRRAWAVSFDRPFAGKGSSLGAADMLYGVRPVVVQAERAGVPLAYLTDLDLAADPRALRGATAYVSMGHDEYWTPSMREAVMSARDHGTNLMFLGADTEFWRIRLAGTPIGPRRLEVGYRWDYRADPMRLRHPASSTAPFGYPPAPRPENALTGERYECYPVDAPYTVSSPHWWGFAGTGVHAGQQFASLVGIEADRVYPGPATPRPLQILSYTRYSCLGVETSAESVYYTTRSGAGVFNAGTLRWTCALAKHSCAGYPVSPATERFVRQVTRNVLRAFAHGPAARAHPAHENVERYYLPDTHMVPAD